MILENEKRNYVNMRRERGEQKMHADASQQGQKMHADASQQGHWDEDWGQDWHDDWHTNQKAHKQSGWYHHSTGAASSWHKQKKKGKR